MSKKVKIIVSVTVAVLLLTVATTATVMAQDEGPVPEEPAPQLEGRTGLLARVAEILGISQEDLVDAFRQAQRETRQEAFTGALDKALDKAMEKGLITQEEADEIRVWWENRPEALDRLSPGIGILKAKRLQQTIGILRGWGRLRTPQLAE